MAQGKAPSSMSDSELLKGDSGLSMITLPLACLGATLNTHDKYKPSMSNGSHSTELLSWLLALSSLHKPCAVGDVGEGGCSCYPYPIKKCAEG